MKKRFKMTLKVEKKCDTVFGQVPLDESGDLMVALGQICSRFGYNCYIHVGLYRNINVQDMKIFQDCFDHICKSPDSDEKFKLLGELRNRGCE